MTVSFRWFEVDFRIEVRRIAVCVANTLGISTECSTAYIHFDRTHCFFDFVVTIGLLSHGGIELLMHPCMRCSLPLIITIFSSGTNIA